MTSKTLSVLLVSKSGDIKEMGIKSFDPNDLYKKAGFKTGDGFTKQTEWGLEVKDTKYNIQLFAKTSGRAGQENKYEFPPPVDTTLFFGTVMLVNIVDDVPTDLSSEEWSKIYETLYGGFDEINNSEDENDEDDEDDAIPKTKQGYAKDGFIVDDDEVEEDVDSSEEEDAMTDSSDEIVTKKKPNSKKPIKSKILCKSASLSVLENTVVSKPTLRSATKQKKKKPEIVETNYLNCGTELEEEMYE